MPALTTDSNVLDALDRGDTVAFHNAQHDETVQVTEQ